MPVVAVGDGIVMGAGAGLFMAAGVRLATERTLFAMPECAIGLCPDAGALHFLNQVCVDPAVGLCMALTGARLGPRDVLDAKLATHFVPKPGLEDTLAEMRVMPTSEVSWLVGRRSEPCTRSPGLLASRKLVERVFQPQAAASAAALVASMEGELERVQVLMGSCGWRTREQAEAEFDALSTWLVQIQAACPSAVNAAWLGMTLSRSQGLPPDAARALEFKLNGWLATRPDFGEGVACAVGARKGEAPVWQGATLEEAAAADDFVAVEAEVRALAPDTVLTDLTPGSPGV